MFKSGFFGEGKPFRRSKKAVSKSQSPSVPNKNLWYINVCQRFLLSLRNRNPKIIFKSSNPDTIRITGQTIRKETNVSGSLLPSFCVSVLFFSATPSLSSELRNDRSFSLFFPTTVLEKEKSRLKHLLTERSNGSNPGQFQFSPAQSDTLQ